MSVRDDPWTTLAPLIRREAARVCVGLDYDTREDIAQETLVRCWLHRDTPLRDPEAFARVVARNVRRDIHKRARIVPHEVLAYRHLQYPASDLTEREVIARLDRRIARLPRRDRDVFLMRMKKDYEYREITRRTRVEERVLKARVSRICQTLLALAVH